MNPQSPELWARDLIFAGVPFVEKGRDRTGLDCWGVVRLGLKELFNIEVPSMADKYRTVKDVEHLERLVTDHLPEWKKVGLEEARAGDVALLRQNNRPIHVGFIYKRGWMVHIEAGIEVCNERYNSKAWSNGRLIGIYRHPELA